MPTTERRPPTPRARKSSFIKGSSTGIQQGTPFPSLCARWGSSRPRLRLLVDDYLSWNAEELHQTKQIPTFSVPWHLTGSEARRGSRLCQGAGPPAAVADRQRERPPESRLVQDCKCRRSSAPSRPGN